MVRRLKRNEIVVLYDVTDTNTNTTHPVLIGEIIDKERYRYLILFKSLNMCAWFEDDYVSEATETEKILYGANK